MRNHLRRWGAVYFLAALALAFNIAHGWTEWKVSTYPSQEEVPWKIEWARSTFENMQSEMWQIFVACLVVDAARRVKRWFAAKEEE